MYRQPVLFHQQDHRAAAIKEHALFLSADDGTGAVVVLDLAYQHGTHLHLGHRTEAAGVQGGDLPAVLGEHRTGSQRDGAHGVQFSAEEAVFPLVAVVHIAVAVVMIHAQTEHQT